MANDNKPKKDRADEAAGNKKVKAKAPAERPFDLWLDKQLHAMYDEIAAEPLPEDIIRAIEHDAQTKGKRSRKK